MRHALLCCVLGFGLVSGCGAGTSNNNDDCGGNHVAGDLTVHSLEDISRAVPAGGKRFCVDGTLRVEQSNLKDLTALGGLKRVGNAIVVEGNAELESVSGLESLESVGAGLLVRNNKRLASIGGLSSLTSVRGTLQLVYNPSLRTLAGLEKLATAGGLELGDDTSSNVCWRGNNALVSLAGLSALATAGSVKIWYNFSLPSAEVASLLGRLNDSADATVCCNAAREACSSAEHWCPPQGQYSAAIVGEPPVDDHCYSEW